jgi:hypothetical protein
MDSFLTVDARAMSRLIAERHGFKPLTTAWVGTWPKDE